MESVVFDSEKFYQDDKYTDLVLIVTLNLVWPLNYFIFPPIFSAGFRSFFISAVVLGWTPFHI